ncbi:MAG: DUF4089 domain-containing protein [Cyanobacteria bacterium P01_A01_bin.45]
MSKNQFDAGEYVDLMMLLLDWDLPDEYRHGVVENFQRIEAIAQLVNEFSLPDNVEVASVFEP